MEESKKLVCARCNVEMIPMPTGFSYLGHVFRTDVPRCPSCGQVFISEVLASGRMAEVETTLEDK